MHLRALRTLLVVTGVFVAINPISAAVETGLPCLAGTQFNVFVLQLPLCKNECGGATITFDEEGRGLMEWNDTSVEGLPFNCTLTTISPGGLLIFSIDEGGWGMAKVDGGIVLLLSGGVTGRATYVVIGVADTCAKEGELFSFVYSAYPKDCCQGLTEWHSGFDTRISIGATCYETGFVKGAPVGTCINCGNGICDALEDVCNCENDCASGMNADFTTIDEFCASERWKEIVHLCEEESRMKNLPLCALCP